MWHIFIGDGLEKQDDVTREFSVIMRQHFLPNTVGQRLTLIKGEEIRKGSALIGAKEILTTNVCQN